MIDIYNVENKLELKTLEDVVNFFKSKGIKYYYSKENRWCYDVSKIIEMTNVLDMLLNKYNKVIIKEISDMLYEDLEEEKKFKEGIKMLSKEQLENADIKKVIEDTKDVTVESNSQRKLYCNIKLMATWNGMFKNKITLNHAYQDRYVEIAVHEFAHALDDTYKLSENKKIINLYKALDKKTIEKDVSDYANENLKEFIAECFTQYYCYIPSNLINRVMKIIEETINEKNKTNAI